MKIALIIEHFDATRGGPEHLAVWLAGQLATRGHEVHVVCHDVASRVNRYRQATQRASHDADLSHRAHPPAEVAHEGIHIHRLKGMRVNTALGFRRFGTRARLWCRTHKPDVIHSLSVAFPGDVFHPCTGLYAAMQAQAAASRTAKASAFKRFLLQLPGKQRTLLVLERKAVLAAADASGPRRLISLCPMMTEQLKAAYGVGGKNVVQLSTPRLVINGNPPSPADDARERAWFRAHYRIAPTDRVALFVGHDFRRKGLRFAIEAVAQTKTPWKLLVVGLGKAREYVELAESLGLGDRKDDQVGTGTQHARVLFVGPTREMGRVYAAADALILPTFYDPVSLVVLEALGHGLPVISTEFMGASALVRQHRVGTIVRAPQSVADMAAALDALPADGSADGKAQAARARVAGASISPSDYVDALLKLYEELRP